jgi:hypothetical protein
MLLGDRAPVMWVRTVRNFGSDVAHLNGAAFVVGVLMQ